MRASHTHPRRQAEHGYPLPQNHPLPSVNMFSGYHHQSQFPGSHYPYFSQPFYLHRYPPQPRPFPQPSPPPPPPSQQRFPVVVCSHPQRRAASPLRHPAVRTPPITHVPMSPASLGTSLSTPQLTPSTPSVFSQSMTPSPTRNMAQSTTVSPAVPAAEQPAVLSIQRSPACDGRKMPYYPNLPWCTNPDEPFPPRIQSQRRRRRAPFAANVRNVELPARALDSGKPVDPQEQRPVDVSKQEAPAASQARPQADSPHPSISSPTPPAASGHSRKPTVPVVPIIPIKLNKTASQCKDSSTATWSAERPSPAGDVPLNGREIAEPPVDAFPKSEDATTTTTTTITTSTTTVATTTSSLEPKIAPKCWADLVRSENSAACDSVGQVCASPAASDRLATVKFDLLRNYKVHNQRNTPFLQPRGLVNTGNMCYMNSILQVLTFCLPFYLFLDEVDNRAAHSFKGETPLLDAMIMFIREFPKIDSAATSEQLLLRLKDAQLEQYGDAFVPEFVYDTIQRLPRFSHMRRGHQQDAEEFLGFLLAALHDECAHLMNPAPASSTGETAASAPQHSEAVRTDEWLEVGPKQKSSVTRSSGPAGGETPIGKIFGGKLRSELHVPGLKTSIKSEPYQPLQLDIGDPSVRNIEDALRALTKPETLHGNFNSPRGPTSVTKQVFIDSLPPVLILHLKRFQYDSTGGTQKIWKKIGYPLDLVIPEAVFTPHLRSTLRRQSRYRLTGIVYHHGRTASGGHYTVDVRRQDGREWIRMDDTMLQRIRSHNVAEDDGADDPRDLAKALGQQKPESPSTSRSIYEQAGFADDADAQDEGGWCQVNGSGSNTGSKKGSRATNGTATPASSTGKRTPLVDKGAKDNKVAYILFYEQIRP